MTYEPNDAARIPGRTAKRMRELYSVDYTNEAGRKVTNTTSWECDFADCWKEFQNAHAYGTEVRGSTGFAGHRDVLVRMLRDGWADPESMKAIEALVEQVGEINVETEGETFDLMPYGSSPSVGSFLAGHPASMRHRMPDENAAAPIRIFFAVQTWGGISHEDANRRGAAAAALALALSNVRPVELYAWNFEHVSGTGRNVMTIVRMGASPFDSARVAALAQNEFNRRFMFTMNSFVAGYKGIDEGPGLGPGRGVRARDLLGAGPNDLVIDRANAHNSMEMIENPLKWVKGRIQAALQGASMVDAEIDETFTG